MSITADTVVRFSTKRARYSQEATLNLNGKTIVPDSVRSATTISPAFYFGTPALASITDHLLVQTGLLN